MARTRKIPDSPADSQNLIRRTRQFDLAPLVVSLGLDSPGAGVRIGGTHGHDYGQA